MWVATIKIDCDNGLFGGLCKKFNVSALGFPILMRSNEDSFRVYFTGIFFGEEKNKREMIAYIKTQTRILNFERHDDFITGEFAESKFAEPLYRHNIIHKEPIKISNDGTEIWTIASFNRKDLISFIDNVEKHFNAEILKIVKFKASNFSIMGIYPDLTKPQKKAMEIAIKHGYYDSPRRIEVQELAKIMGLSYSTYHVHLRKAEKKLIPFFFERI